MGSFNDDFDSSTSTATLIPDNAAFSSDTVEVLSDVDVMGISVVTSLGLATHPEGVRTTNIAHKYTKIFINSLFKKSLNFISKNK